MHWLKQGGNNNNSPPPPRALRQKSVQLDISSLQPRASRREVLGSEDYGLAFFLAVINLVLYSVTPYFRTYLALIEGLGIMLQRGRCSGKVLK